MMIAALTLSGFKDDLGRKFDLGGWRAARA